jgi:hypothetical protein
MTVPNRDLRAEPPDEPQWSDDGRWEGPHDVRAFLRHNRFFAGFWFIVAAPIGWAMFVSLAPLRDDYAVPIGAFVGVGFWWLFMFLFSHGLIAEGD